MLRDETRNVSLHELWTLRLFEDRDWTAAEVVAAHGPQGDRVSTLANKGLIARYSPLRRGRYRLTKLGREALDREVRERGVLRGGSGLRLGPDARTGGLS